MELKAANNLIKNALAIMAAEGLRPTAKAETQGLLFLLGQKEAPKTQSVRAENNRLFFRILRCMQDGPEKFDSAALSRLHEQLYSPRPGAGKLRTVPKELEGFSFTDSSFIAGSLKRLLLKMGKLTPAPESSKEDFALPLTHYFSEMFLLCPFGGGSFIAESLFFWHFVKSKGFYLNFHRSGRSFIEAVKTAFFTDEAQKLYVCFTECLSYLRQSESEENRAEESAAARPAPTKRAKIQPRGIRRKKTAAAKPQPAGRTAAKKAETEKERAVKPAKKQAVETQDKKAVRQTLSKKAAGEKTAESSDKRAAPSSAPQQNRISIRDGAAAAESAAAADKKQPSGTESGGSITWETDAECPAFPAVDLSGKDKEIAPAEGQSGCDGKDFETDARCAAAAQKTDGSGVNAPDAVQTGSQAVQTGADTGGRIVVTGASAHGGKSDGRTAGVTAEQSGSQSAAALPFIADLPASVLKKAAKLKQKIETLQEQLKVLLSPYDKK